MELVCPAGNFASLKAAVDSGADAVYIGINDKTNARYFPGLNFNHNNLGHAVDYARNKGVRVFLAINTFPQQANWQHWCSAVDCGIDADVNALIIADVGVMNYAASRNTKANLHLSVQASSTSHESLLFYYNNFGIKRAVLPRVLALKQIERLANKTPIELEVFGFGSLCIMVEGRCYLSSYLTGDSPNNCGVCSPAHAVDWKETNGTLTTRLNNIVIDRFLPGEAAGYPTLCKGRFRAEENTYHVMEEPTSLNAMELIPKLSTFGIKAIKIEGRQRSPAYVAKVTSIWRKAIDDFKKSNNTAWTPKEQWNQALAALAEGTQTTYGAYHRSWQ